MLTKEDIATLNAARDVLKALTTTATRLYCYEEAVEGVDGHDLGRICEAADIAGDAVFNVLNVTSNYGKVPMSEDELHNRKAEAVV